MGPELHTESHLAHCQSGCEARRDPKSRFAWLTPHLRATLSPSWGRTWTDSVLAGPCIGSDDRALPGMQTETATRGEWQLGPGSCL